jgi:two-component system, OmpR family, response regulator
MISSVLCSITNLSSFQRLSGCCVASDIHYRPFNLPQAHNLNILIYDNDMRILIIEDDLILADGLKNALIQSGYAVDWLKNGVEADSILAYQTFDLVVLDLGLPKLNGFEILKRLRTRGSTIPVLILTASEEIDNRVKGLDYGADDYLCKPFNLAELEARVRALIRRGQSGGSAIFSVGKLFLDSTNRSASYDDEHLNLSARELAVLEMLILKAGKVVNKEQMLDKLCNFDEEISDNALEVYLHRLRKKLDHSDINIRTIRGLGYMLEIKKP